MAITSSAKKALRSAKRKRVFNIIRSETMKDVLRDIKKLVEAKNKSDALKLVPKAYQAIDKAAKTNYIKKNAASRKKARLMASIKRM